MLRGNNELGAVYDITYSNAHGDILITYSDIESSSEAISDAMCKLLEQAAEPGVPGIVVQVLVPHLVDRHRM